jgi:hypothetical protein
MILHQFIIYLDSDRTSRKTQNHEKKELVMFVIIIRNYFIASIPHESSRKTKKNHLKKYKKNEQLVMFFLNKQIC